MRPGNSPSLTAAQAEALIDASQGQGADVASAATIDLDAVVGESCDVTGTTTITAVTLASGRSVLVRFTGILTLTHSASLVLPNSSNITTEANDYILFQGYAGGVVRAVIYSTATVPDFVKPGYYTGFGAAQWAAPTPVGAGATSSANDFGIVLFGPSTAVGYAIRYNSPGSSVAVCRGKNVGVIDWSRSLEIKFTMLIYGAALHANCTARFSVGKLAADLAGALARRGVSIEFTGTGAMVVRLHNGTTATPTTTTFTYTVNQAFDVRLVSNGAGTSYIWVNDTLVGTGTGGPTTAGASEACINQGEVENTGITTTQGIVNIGGFTIHYKR